MVASRQFSASVQLGSNHAAKDHGRSSRTHGGKRRSALNTFSIRPKKSIDRRQSVKNHLEANRAETLPQGGIGNLIAGLRQAIA
jgi:hypothetical protein